MSPKQSELYQLLVLTAEVMGHPLGVPAARVMASDLAGYTEDQITKALVRVRREHTGRLSTAAITSRIDTGHLGVEEAWALCPRDESATVVWTDEIARAFGVAAPLLAQGDQVAGRMAFKEVYTQEMRDAADAKRAPSWFPSLGHDPASRDAVLLEAVERGRLPAAQVERMLTADAGRDRLAQLTGGERKALPKPAPAEPEAFIPPSELAALARSVVEARRLKS